MKLTRKSTVDFPGVFGVFFPNNTIKDLIFFYLMITLILITILTFIKDEKESDEQGNW